MSFYLNINQLFLLPFTPTLLLSAPSMDLFLPLFLCSLSGSLCRLLLELLELLFDKFKAVAQAHSVVLAHMQQIKLQGSSGTPEEDIKLYEQADVSAKIQTVLQVSSEERHWNLHNSEYLKDFFLQKSDHYLNILFQLISI